MVPANPKPVDEPLFSALVTPHRSLQRGGFLVFMAAVAMVSFAAGLLFLSMGAWPVFAFFGLDVVLIWWAFRVNYRAARAREIVEVSRSQVLVRRITHRGHRSQWSFNPCWVRLSVSRDGEGRAEHVTLASHGRACEIGYWLSPPEKDDFAGALGAALAAARGAG